MDSSRRTEGFALALTAAVLWGLGPTATKLALAGYPPELVGVARLGSAALLFRLLCGPTTRWLPRDVWSVLAGVGLGVDFVLYNYGVQRTTAGAAAVLLNLGSVTTPLFARWLLRERLDARRLTGIALTLAGVSWVASDGLDPRDLLGSERVVGNLLVLVATTCWSFYAVAQQRARTDRTGPQLMAPIFVVGAALSLLVLPGMHATVVGGLVPTVALAVLALVCTAAVYVVYARSQECLPLSVLSTVHATVPLFSITLAAVVLGEPLTPRLAVGAGAVMVGILVGVKRSA